MSLPHRQGMTAEEWARAVAPYERDRDAALRRTTDPEDLGGVGVIWYRRDRSLTTQRLGIQPGIADDLPSLLSTLAAEIAWPGVQPEPAPSADRAVGIWVRVWQVRDAADLRVVLRWDAAGQFSADAALCPPVGPARPLEPAQNLTALLNQYAVKPRASTSPHGLLLAGNQAMAAGDAAAARACYEQALRDLPRHAEAHRNLALALAQLAAWEQAVAEMQRAWELAAQDPTLGREYLALMTDAGIAAVRDEQPAQAAGYFLQILSLWPEEPTALVNLGNIRLREGRLQEARAIFRRFLRLHPQHAAADSVRMALQEIDPTAE